MRCFDCLQWGPPLPDLSEDEGSQRPAEKFRWHAGKKYAAFWQPQYPQLSEEAQRKAFKKDVKHAWAAEAVKSGKASQRLRGIAWKKAVEEVQASGQNFNRTEVRKALLTATGMFCVRMVAARLRASAEEKRAMESAMKEAADEYARRAEDANYVTARVEGAFLDANTSQWLSQLVEGLDEYFICRRKACRWFVPTRCG